MCVCLIMCVKYKLIKLFIYIIISWFCMNAKLILKADRERRREKKQMEEEEQRRRRGDGIL